MTIYMWIYHELFYGYLWKLMGARMDMAVETWEFKCMVELSIMATSFNLPDTWSIAAHFTRPCPGDARGRTAAEGKTSDILLPRSIFSALNTSTCFFFSRFFNHIPAISHGFFLVQPLAAPPSEGSGSPGTGNPRAPPRADAGRCVCSVDPKKISEKLANALFFRNTLAYTSRFFMFVIESYPLSHPFILAVFCTCSGGLLRIRRYLISKLTWFEEVAVAPLCQAKNTMQIRLREQEVGEMHLGFLEIFVDSEVNSSQPAQPSMFLLG